MALDSVEEYLVSGLLALWLAVTMICQPESRLSAWIRKRDHLNLVPAWTFFAPNPGVQDFHLLFRDELTDGRTTPWQEIQLVSLPVVFGMLWNPGRRQNKALIDIVKYLAQEAIVRRMDPHGLRISLPYIALLNFVSNLPRAYQPTKTQFMLMRSSRLPALEPECELVSAMHDICVTAS